MKNYIITVNGKEYDVTVEEKLETSFRKTTSKEVEVSHSTKNQDVKETVVVEKEFVEPVAIEKVPQSKEAGNVIVKAGAAGKIVKIIAEVGQEVKSGDSVVVLEAMKMEIPVVAPSGGKVVSIDVSTGDLVEAGAVLVTLRD